MILLTKRYLGYIILLFFLKYFQRVCFSVPHREVNDSLISNISYSRYLSTWDEQISNVILLTEWYPDYIPFHLIWINLKRECFSASKVKWSRAFTSDECMAAFGWFRARLSHIPVRRNSAVFLQKLWAESALCLIRASALTFAVTLCQD